MRTTREGIGSRGPRRARVALFGLLVLACTSPAPPGDATRSAVWGYVRLVPREGVAPSASGPGRSAAYADRRYADATLVDYTRPGFAVVHLEGDPPGPPQDAPDAEPALRLRLRSGLGGLRIEPARAALRVGGTLELTNETEAPSVVSCPDLGFVRRLGPGQRTTVAVDRPGPLELFVPGAREAHATLLAATGPFAVVSSAGRFELSDVAPGPRVLHVWHPRFPPSARPVVLAPGEILRVDVELGVGIDAGAAARGGR